MEAEKATKFYDGIVIQTLFGTQYVTFFPVNKQFRQVGLRELDHHKIVDAKFEGTVLMIVGINDKGEYDRFIFRFDKTWESHDVRIIQNIQFTGLNFTVLDNGVCISITEEEKIEIFHGLMGRDGIKEVDDDVIKGDMKLTHKGAMGLFTRDNKIYSISMAKQP
jgi:hypothetical protein